MATLFRKFPLLITAWHCFRHFQVPPYFIFLWEKALRNALKQCHGLLFGDAWTSTLHLRSAKEGWLEVGPQINELVCIYQI